MPKQSTWPQKSFIYLDEVTLRSRAEAGEEGAGALVRDDLLEAADEALVVLDRVQLDARLHHVHRRQRAVREYFKDNYPDAPVSVTNGPSGCNRIVRELPSPVPHVTIIIPTRDCTEFVKACVFSLFDKTDYPSFDVIIVDNDSVEVELTEYLAETREKHPVTILPYSGEFNYSAMNNFAVEHASGSVVVLLNNDTQVISSEWLREMVL